jgi:hypothetical protein
MSVIAFVFFPVTTNVEDLGHDRSRYQIQTQKLTYHFKVISYPSHMCYLSIDPQFMHV